MKYIISIIVPTKNRIKYALSLAQTCEYFSNRRVQLVIYDNSDLPLSPIDSVFLAENIVYYYDPSPLSFVDNWSRALKFAEGKYILMLGDDDGYHPAIDKICDWMDRLELDFLVGNLNADYRWNGLEHVSQDMASFLGDKFYLTESSRSLRKINCQNILENFIKNGCIQYLNYDFPKLYHGIVNKRYLSQALLANSGKIGGLSPDIYAAIVLANQNGRGFKIDFPITISGTAPESASAKEYGLSKLIIPIEKAPHLKFRGNYNWSSRILPIYTPDTIWAESSLAALIDAGSADLASKFNEVKFLAYISSKNFKIYKYILSIQEKVSLIFIIELTYLLVKFYIINYYNRIIKKLKKIFLRGKFKVYNNVHNIKEATEILNSNIEWH